MTYLAVFDWNSTLFDDIEACLAGSNAAFEVLGVAPIDMDQYQRTATFPILHFYVANGVSPDDYLARHDEIASTFLVKYEEEALKYPLRDNVIELLQWMKGRDDIHTMILSNHLQENVEISLRRFGITAFFDSVSGNPSFDAATISSTNKLERLSAFMDDHGFTPDKAFIIGDSAEEPDLAHKLGLTSFSITGGVLNEERLRAANPTHLVHDFFAVEKIVKEMWAA